MRTLDPAPLLAAAICVVIASHARAGDCMDLDTVDDTCVICTRELLRAEHSIEYLGEGDGEMRSILPSDSRCLEQIGDDDTGVCYLQWCFDVEVVGEMVKADQDDELRARAGFLLNRMGARSRGGWHSSTLKKVREHYGGASELFRETIDRLLRSIGGHESSIAVLLDWRRTASGELSATLDIALTQVAAAGDHTAAVRARLRKSEHVSAFYRARLPLPKVVESEFDFAAKMALKYLDDRWLRIYRNAVFARHGRRFESEDLASFFAAQAWYKPNPDYTDAQLTPGDRDNLAYLARETRRRNQKSKR